MFGAHCWFIFDDWCDETMVMCDDSNQDSQTDSNQNSKTSNNGQVQQTKKPDEEFIRVKKQAFDVPTRTNVAVDGKEVREFK